MAEYVLPTPTIKALSLVTVSHCYHFILILYSLIDVVMVLTSCFLYMKL